MPTRRDIGILEYVSPRERKLSSTEAKVRMVAYALKSPRPSPAAIRVAVRVMKPWIQSTDVLVPIPDSKGSTQANFALVRALARSTGASVEDVLGRSTPVQSSTRRRRHGLPGLAPEEHSMTTSKILRGSNIVFIDNVMTTGATFHAARQALGAGRGLAFARARETLG